tara:strand:+ start:108 stop:542 length:435 start_codon:yes stop_codon:yes gene_type:complete
MTTLEFIKNEIKNNCENLAKSYDITVSELVIGDITEILFSNNKLVFSIDGFVTYSDDLKSKENLSLQLTCSYKTPKGYISSKKLPVEIKDVNNVTLEEATELLKFNTDAIKNTFDPFYHENESKRRSAIGWNAVASNYLQSDCR